MRPRKVRKKCVVPNYNQVLAQDIKPDNHLVLDDTSYPHHVAEVYNDSIKITVYTYLGEKLTFLKDEVLKVRI